MLSWVGSKFSISFLNFPFLSQFLSLNTTFSKSTTQKAVLFTVFSLLELFFSRCIVVTMAKGNLLNTPAIVSLANFQRIQMLWHPRLAFDWLSECMVCFFLCTELTLFCTELTLFCTELPENCIYLSQSELSNFLMYIINCKIVSILCPFFP